MALPVAIQGAKRPSPLITWTDADGAAVDLDGAAITARILHPETGTIRDSDGTFMITDAANGVFRWDYGDADVAAAGEFTVQFTAAFSSGPTPGRTFKAAWSVEGIL